MIRELTENDYIFVNNIGNQLNDDFDINKKFNNNVEKLYGYEQDNQILGFIQIQNSFGDVDIINIAVNSEYQHQGIGQLLVNYVIDEIKPKKIMLEVRASNNKAINFYQKIGFQEIHRRKNYYGNEDAIIMEMII